MRQSSVLYLVAPSLARAAWQRLQPGSGSMPLAGAAGLLARQNGECTIHSSCSGCFGEGYVICDTIGCFNPDIYQQCCSGALLCVGRTNNCCKDWGGPGVTGTAGVPNVTAAPTPTASASDESSYTCTRGDEGEECCQRAPIPLHWCSGNFPNFRCYNEKNQFCCTDGTVCDEEDCCDLFSAKTTHPWAATATTAPTTTGSATGSVTQGPTITPTTDTTAAPESTTTSTAGAGPGPKPGFMALGLVALGLGAL